MDCGIPDGNIKTVECSASCYITNFWINTVNDKPLTMHSCGRLDEKGIKEKDKCKAVCEKDLDLFLRSMDGGSDENTRWPKNMKKLLTIYAKDSSKLSDECLKFLTNIDSISVAKCSEGLEVCREKYCPYKPDENCKMTPPKTTVASATEKPSQAGKSETTIASATVKPNQAGKSATTVVAATGPTSTGPQSNEIGNGTTSGGAKIIPALFSMSFFTRTFVMKRFL